MFKPVLLLRMHWMDSECCRHDPHQELSGTTGLCPPLPGAACRAQRDAGSAQLAAGIARVREGASLQASRAERRGLTHRSLPRHERAATHQPRAGAAARPALSHRPAHPPAL